MEYLEQILPLVEGYIQVIQVGDDLGMQDGPQISPNLYRKVVKSRHKKLYQYIKKNIPAHIFFYIPAVQFTNLFPISSKWA